jgi:predicted O-methyltransferase YrrM
VNKSKIFHKVCKKIENRRSISNSKIFEDFDLLSGHPWEEAAKSDATTYYPCLYEVVRLEKPGKILEIGTAFGMSAATMIKACKNIKLFTSLDLGIYGDILGTSLNNLDFARSKIHVWCEHNNISKERVRFYRANTQPPGKGDNEDAGDEIQRWYMIPEVVRLLESHEFDVIFVDGKHTDDGLLNDLNSFWPFLKPGGLIICDDLHDPEIYKDVFPWVGDTLDSFTTFIGNKAEDIIDYYIWDYPQVPPLGKNGLRPFGLIRKNPGSQTIKKSVGFEMFDSPGAIAINIARQDHLASLGLELANQSVLEVGAGVGWHTAFFEKLGCKVLSTDARIENVAEHLQRYSYRRVEVADLSIPDSHNHFGKFDIVYCYGTLYHLSNPSLCIEDLSKNCLKLFLIETCVNQIDNNSINLAEEDRNNPNQSFYGLGCRPSRDWVMYELHKYFPYVYLTIYQPYHADFPLQWPAKLKPGINTRSVFVASKKPLNLLTVTPTLINKQKRLKRFVFSIKNQTYQKSVSIDKIIS